MKKFICAFLSLILLCSCSSGADVQVVNRGLTFKAHIFYLSDKYVCSGEISRDGVSTFKVEEGKICGFTAVCNGEKAVLSYEGKKSEQEYSALEKSFFLPVALMFSYFDSNEYSVEEVDNSFFVKGETSLGEFTLFVSPAGLPISVQFISNGFSVDFYDVAVQKG